MWSQNRDDCGLESLVLWVATGSGVYILLTLPLMNTETSVKSLDVGVSNCRDAASKNLNYY